MSKDISPKDLYIEFESELSPLLRKVLAHYLPMIAGNDWWEKCVLSSLSSIQLDYVKSEQSLNQFDYPALVNIFYRNWRSLRPLMGVGNELTNYLFTIKTFRNDATHQPDLVLDQTRVELLRHSVSLASELLNNSCPLLNNVQIPSVTTNKNFHQPKFNKSKKVGTFFVITVCLVLLLLANADLFTQDAIVDSKKTSLSEQQDPQIEIPSKKVFAQKAIECAKLHFERDVLVQYKTQFNVDLLLAELDFTIQEKCSDFKDLTKINLSLEERHEIQSQIVNNLTMNGSNPPNMGPVQMDEYYLSAAYVTFVRQGRFPDGQFEQNRDELIKEIKLIQKKHGLKQTGKPDQFVITLIENARK